MKVLALMFILMAVHYGNEAMAVELTDFSTITCKQFWENTKEGDKGPFLFWLNGYFQHKNNSHIINPVVLAQQVQALAIYCARQPNMSILSAAEKTFLD